MTSDSAIFSFRAMAGIASSGDVVPLISQALGLPVISDESIADGDLDTLIIAGVGASGSTPFARASLLTALASAVTRARRVISIQRDYRFSLPKPESEATSAWRSSFRERRDSGKAPAIYWSSVDHSDSSGIQSVYLNWCAVAYRPLVNPAPRVIPALYYFGHYRKGRHAYFERYFRDAVARTVISTNPNKKDSDVFFGYLGEHVEITQDSGSDLLAQISQHALGLYLEDQQSHVLYCSPANRHYEMVAAGIPVVYQLEARATMMRGGFELSDDWIAPDASAVPRLLENSGRLLHDQAHWPDICARHRHELDAQIKNAWSVSL